MNQLLTSEASKPDAAGSANRVQIGVRQKRLLAEPLAFEERDLTVTVRALLLMATVLVAAFVVWAWLTPIDEVATAPGQVIPTGEVKTIQHLEGGVVAFIPVHEGQVVQAGDVLIRMDPAAARSELDQGTVRANDLALRIERLLAVLEEREPKYEGLPEGLAAQVAEQQRIAANQRESNRSALAVIDSEIAQRREELAQFKRMLEIAQQQLQLTKGQVAIRKAGVASGVVARQVLLETQRAEIASTGEVFRLTDQIRVSENTLAEQERRRTNQSATQRQAVLTEMASARNELEQTKKLIDRLTDRVTRLEVRSPVDGVVQDIKVHAAGEVILPAGILMRVVPLDKGLLVEARIGSADVGRIRVQQAVRLKISSYDYTRYGALPGRLEQISPATFIDEQGKPYYRVMISLRQPFMGPAVGQDPILPGMIVMADISTGRRTLAEYLLKPVVASISESFHEH